MPFSRALGWTISTVVTACWLLGCEGEMDGSDPADGSSSTVDAGPPSDSGIRPDAGPRDAGVMPMGTDAGGDSPDAGPTGAGDSDGDGLRDAWESAAGNAALLDPARRDTDGNGRPDGDEDFDRDGLSAREEQAFGELTTSPAGGAPHPFRVDLVIELDAMVDRVPSDTVLREVANVYAALPISGAGGAMGVNVSVYRDEMGIAAFDFDGSFPQRHDFLHTHGPMLSASHPGSAIPWNKMVHVAIVSRRMDIPERGGEMVTDGEGTVENTGVLIFYDVIRMVHPRCGVPGMPLLREITFEEGLASSTAHELGHVLQLGHDTAVGGGIDTWNIMSVPQSCLESQNRFHGYMNHDATLGATQEAGASRFSHAAAALMDFTRKISVDTAMLTTDTGLEM